jgi:hypothetical protein
MNLKLISKFWSFQITSVSLARLIKESCRVADVAPRMSQLRQEVWHDFCVSPSSSFFLSFFLPSSSSPLLAAAPLTILEFPPLLEACGASNQLHELVPQSCWVYTLSLSSHFVAF